MIKRTIISGMLLLTLAALTVPTIQAQQLKVPAPSPTQTLKQNFALSEITIEYSRPGVKGREIFGGLVPFGKIWRTGANQSTKITFGEDVTVQGLLVKAGTYAIYTIPNKDSWEFMFYKDLTLGGDVAEYKAENEVLRFKASPVAIANKVETFTINVADITPKTANIELCWDMTRVSFSVSSDIDSKIMKNIETALATDARPYYQAANYFYDNNKDLNQALIWATRAFDNNPKAYWMAHLKAKIQLKLKDTKGAIASANQSMVLAKEDKNDDFIKLNEALIGEAQKTK